MEAYLTPADELYYGGAAGGGKSDLLLGLALTAHTKSIIFRREFTQLTELIDRSRELLDGTRASFNGQRYLWTRIYGGRTLEFGAVKHEEYKEKYKGRPHDLKGFDEIPDFTESVFRYLNAWARTTIPEQRVRVVCAGNPPLTPEGEWVVRYWAPWLDSQYSNPAVPGELRYFAFIDAKDTEVESGEPFDYKDELIQPKSRTFIPALLRDNPILERTGYRAQLQALPEPMRSKLLFGDFAVESAHVSPWQLIRQQWVRESWQRWEAGPSCGMTSLGVDAARGGDDDTVLAKKYGDWVAPLEVHPGRTTPDAQSVVNLIVETLGDQSGVVINVDVIGIGSSVYDLLRERGLQANAVNFSEKSYELDKTGELGFLNKRAECYWKVREALEPESVSPIRLPPDNYLLSELVAHNWLLKARGIQIESKDAVRKRIGRSPNRSDAVVLAHFEGSSGVFFM